MPNATPSASDLVPPSPLSEAAIITPASNDPAIPPQPPADNDHLAPDASPFDQSAMTTTEFEVLQQRIAAIEEDLAGLRKYFAWPTNLPA